MYLLVCLAILGSAYGAAVPVTDVVVRTQPELYVLPKDTYPTFYDVTLFLDPGNPNGFSGRSTVRIFSHVETSEIVLHAMALNILSIRVTNDMDTVTNIYDSFSLATDDTQLLKITVSQPLVPYVPYTIEFIYEGQYAENMFGIYVSTYEYEGATRSLITSQLQPTFARRAFPCYDEPAYKAIFRTTIYAPPQYGVVRSNTNIRETPLKPEVTGYIKHEFDDTLVMSSYLIAYLVSDFPHIENTGVNAIYRIPFRVYSRPGTQVSADFALKFGQDNMVALEAYTEFDYAFEKMDKAAVPDFAAGAMENWGLVIYREVALLVVEGVTTTATKQNIGRIICHENMHQWFGNEVSPTSWTYTWLNEGFANFFENFATDLSIDGWRMMDQFVIALQNVFQSDAVLSVNSMTHEVYTPSEILGTFNAVAYQKSGSVIRMMQHFLTPEIFRQGLAYYIRTNSRKAVTPVDLYEALQTVLDQSDHSIPYQIADVMNWWANQGGFPVLQVNRTAPAAASISVTQRRYLTDSSQTSNFRWLVPFNLVLSTNPDFSDTSPQYWLSRSTIAQSYTVQGLPQAAWYIVNKQQTGYYRVNYDIQNWAALANVMNENHEIIHLLNRAQLLDDAFNLARTGALNYRYPFELSRYLVKEKDYIPWAAVNPALSYLDLALSGSDQYQLFQAYLLELTAPLYAELGFNVNPGEEHVAPYHRNIILDLNCRHGNSECISTAAQMLANFKNDPTTPLNPDIQNLVYCSGLRGGDVDNFSFLWERYLASTDSSEQSILLGALGCTSNVERRTFYLNQIIDPNTLVRQQDRHTILVSVINSSPDNMDAALDFAIEHWPSIQNNVQGLSGTNNILTAFSRRLTTQAHREKINEFSSRHSSIFTAAEAALVGAIEENIESSITWNNQNAAVVEEWLTENDGSEEPTEPTDPAEPTDPEDSGEDDGAGDGAAAISASLFLLVAVSIISLFNST